MMNRDQKKWDFILKKIGSIFLIFFAMTLGAHAQGVDLTVSIDKASVLLGDVINLTITVRGDDRPETPQIPAIQGFDQKFSGTRQESFRSYTVVVQGKTVKNEKSGGGYFFDYHLIPKKAGKFQIPSFLIEYKNTTYPTQPFEIEVLDQHEQSDDIFLKVSASKSELYLGERTEVVFEWYFSQDIQNYALQIPWLEGLKGFLVSDPEIESKRAQYFQINDGQKVIAEKGKEVYKGKQYTVVRFRKILTPIASGEYALEAPFLKCDVISGYQQNQTRSVFDEFFDTGFGGSFGARSRAVTREFVTRGEALSINVKALPEAGVSTNFSGGVGKFKFHVDASPVQLKIGEPITLRMMIAGDGNLDTVKSPKIEIGPAFKTYESESKILKDSNTGVLVKVFERVLVPREAGQHRIDEVVFEYFDTARGEYVSVKSDPIIIQVEAGVASDASTYIAPLNKPSVKSALINEPVVLKEDIRFIKHSYAIAQPLDRVVWLNRILRLLVFIFPLLAGIWIGMNYFHRRLEANPAFKRRLRAEKRFQILSDVTKKCIPSASNQEFGEKLLKAIGEYLSDTLNQPPGKAMHELLDILELRVGEGFDFKELRSICEQSEGARYAAKNISLQERQMLIERLEDSIKKMSAKL